MGTMRLVALSVLLTAVSAVAAEKADETGDHWAANAVFYQIFPERFANGDPNNDPTRESLEFPDNVSNRWKPSSWTGDWYARSPWELSRGKSFFEDGVFDRRYGGDLQGVIDRLDHLERLGVNAVYFNPVFYGKSLHKYDGASMHHIDPYFGPDPAGDLAQIDRETSDPASWKWTAADRLFLQLVEALHARKIRVVIDGVFNHTGRDFFAFAHLREHQQESPYRDWYMVKSFDDPNTEKNEFQYKGWWDVDTLPEFADNDYGNDLHPGPKEYVLNITRRWMDPNGDGDPSDGIDGWRLDVANEVPMRFWQDWNALVRELNPQAYTVAEIWDDAGKFLADGGFSATMNYHAFAYPVKGFLIDGRMPAADFVHDLNQRREQFPAAMQRVLQNLIDSHDTPRLASMIVNRKHQPYVQAHRFDYDVGERATPRWWDQFDVSAPGPEGRRILRIVALMQMTYVGAPMVYYGTEAGMWGGDDPCDRMPMVWPDLEYDAQAADPLGRPREADAVAFDRELFEFYASVIQLRRDHPALCGAEIEFLAADNDAKFVAYVRKSDREQIVVALNRGETEHVMELPEGNWEVA
ncbi:glycoside hydrolase family 13 protein, partial [Pirellulales bacterium]|nr:glycoside hydrolase family 13 protein [Pirellulales bacterium]